MKEYRPRSRRQQCATRISSAIQVALLALTPGSAFCQQGAAQYTPPPPVGPLTPDQQRQLNNPMPASPGHGDTTYVYALTLEKDGTAPARNDIVFSPRVVSAFYCKFLGFGAPPGHPEWHPRAHVGWENDACRLSGSFSFENIDTLNSYLATTNGSLSDDGCGVALHLPLHFDAQDPTTNIRVVVTMPGAEAVTPGSQKSNGTLSWASSRSPGHATTLDVDALGQLSTQESSSETTTFMPSVSSTDCPRIVFTDNGVDKDITDKTVDVELGQQIQLTARPAGDTPQDGTRWTVMGDVNTRYNCFVAGKAPSDKCAYKTTPPDYRQLQIQYFWIDSALQKKVSYHYLRNGKEVESSATFNIRGPSSAAMTTPFGHTDISSFTVSSCTAPCLILGGSVGNRGITFNGSVSMGMGRGKLALLQIVNSTNIHVTMTPPTQPCTGAHLLDFYQGWNHDTGISYEDNPGFRLKPEFSDARIDFDATTYLLWSSELPNAIAVPLGYVNWKWSAAAANSNKSSLFGDSWRLTKSVIQASDFFSSNIYPTWDKTASAFKASGCK